MCIQNIDWPTVPIGRYTNTLPKDCTAIYVVYKVIPTNIDLVILISDLSSLLQKPFPLFVKDKQRAPLTRKASSSF